MLSATVSFSQVVYQSSDFATVGDSIHVSKATTGLSGFDFIQTGVNHFWNYDTLPFSTQNDIKWIDPSTAGYKATWCLTNSIIFGCNAQFGNFTNLATNDLDSLQFGSFEVSNVVKHYNKDANNLNYKMLGGTLNIGGLPIIKIAEINDADTVYNFPLQYNDIDSCSSDYAIKISGDSTKYVSYYKRHNNVEGWGTLTTPYTTFNNVLKVKTTITKIDTIFLGGTPNQYIDTLIEFKWFDPAYQIPVLEVKANKVGLNIVTTGITYIDSLRCVDPQAFALYSPLVPYWDSISGGVDIAFSNLSSNADSVFWDFGDGNTSHQFNPTHNFQCPGIQTVQLIAVGKTCFPYRADTIQIPIIIQDTTEYFNSSQNANICQGDSILLGGAYQTSEGIYTDTLQTIHGCDSLIITTLTVNLIPLKPIISLNGSVLSSDAASGNQWYNQTGIISGATNQNYTVLTDGDYYDIVTLNGCSSEPSDTINVIILSIQNGIKDKVFVIYPNPVSDVLTIEMKENNEKINFEILNSEGKVVFNSYLIEKTTILTSTFAQGVYIIKLENGNAFEFVKIIKQ